MKRILLYFFSTAVLFIFSFLGPLQAQIITTVAGNGTGGYIDGVPATAAEIFNPLYLYIDSVGNMYISAQNNDRVRLVNTSGIMNTYAGTGINGFTGDGSAATLADMKTPHGVVADRSGNIYIADANNYRIRRVDASGIITTIAGTGTVGFYGDGGMATLAQFNFIEGIAIDTAGNLYVADAGNNRIRKISPATGGVVTTVAGNGSSTFGGDGGPATAAALWGPYDIALDAAGDLYIADHGNNRIRKVDASGMISTFAGNGTPGYTGDGITATTTELNGPPGVAIDGCGNVYIADETNNRIRKVDVAGIITTIAGTGTGAYGGDGGPATAGIINAPFDVKADEKGNIFIVDYQNQRIRKVSSINRSPYFTGGHSQDISVCADSAATLNALLAVIDSDQQQGETWSVFSAPAHGTLTAAYTTISTGGTLIPSGLSYSPGGYIGSDSFKIVISDCADLHDTTTVYVTAKSCPLSVHASYNSAGSIEIFPNPNAGTFSLYISSATTNEAHIIITNLVGEKVKELTTLTNQMAGIQLDVAPGMYFCKVITKEGNYMEKVLVSK